VGVNTCPVLLLAKLMLTVVALCQLSRERTVKVVLKNTVKVHFEAKSRYQTFITRVWNRAPSSYRPDADGYFKMAAL
jgi:hypothetical protein